MKASIRGGFVIDADRYDICLPLLEDANDVYSVPFLGDFPVFIRQRAARSAHAAQTLAQREARTSNVASAAFRLLIESRGINKPGFRMETKVWTFQLRLDNGRRE